MRTRTLLGAEVPREIAASSPPAHDAECDMPRGSDLRPAPAMPPSPGNAAPERPSRQAALGEYTAAPTRSPRRDLRPLNAPTPLRVQLDELGRVVSIWRHGRLAPRRIAAIQDRWRIDDEWWREHAVSRMYYALLLDDGTLLTVYQDLLADEWFEQRS